MSKIFPVLLFFISLNCIASLSSNCTNVENNDPKIVENLLNYIHVADENARFQA